MITILRRQSIVFAATAAVLIAMAGSATAASDPPDGNVTGSDSPAQLVVPRTGQKVRPFTSLKSTAPQSLPGSENATGSALDFNAAAAAASKLRTVDNPDKARSQRGIRGGTEAAPSFIGNPAYYCDEVIDKQMRLDYDEIGSQRLQVDYYGDVACNFSLYEGTGVAGIIDRTPGYDGQVLSVGNVFDFQYGYYGYSTGQMVVWGDTDRRARSIEIVDEVYLYSPIPWGACGPLPGLRYLACDGLGSYVLHVVVGTGPISTGLQDPPLLYIGADPGDACFVDTVIDADPVTQDPGQGMHRVKITQYGGTISCDTSGFSGTSRAVLHSVGRGQPGADRDLATGSPSGTDGNSSGPPVTVAESEDGGRIVRTIYRGQTTAPAGRTWGGCHSPDDEEYTFTKCSISGNVVDWEATGRVIGTELPDELHCEWAASPPRLLGSQVVAGGYVACDGLAEVAEEMSMQVRLSAEYTDTNGTPQDREVGFGIRACFDDIIMLGCSLQAEDVARLPGTSLDYTSLVQADCTDDPQRQAMYHTWFSARITHYGGWVERTNEPGLDQSYTCIPN